MGWFQELINARLVNDEELLKGAFADLSSTIIGERAAYAILKVDKERTKSAIGDILTCFHAQTPEIPEDMENITDRLDYMLRPSGILRRTVHLDAGWYKDCIGPLLGERNGAAIALIPYGFSGYRFVDPDTGKNIKVTASNAGEIGKEAFSFYKPLPEKALGIKDLVKYMMSALSRADITYFLLALLAVTVLGMVTPVINNVIFAGVIPSGETGLLYSSLGVLIGVMLSTFLITICKNLLMTRISTKIQVYVQAAFMGRTLALPTAFFKKYSTGDIGERMNVLAPFCDLLTGSVLSIGMTALFSLLYVFQIFSYAPVLVFPALLTLAVTLAFSLRVISVQSKLTNTRLETNAKTNGLIFELIKGIQKIKLVGGETRAFAQWARKYREIAKVDFAPPLIIKSSAALTALITLLGVILIYFFAGASGIRPADFMAFNVAYGMVSGAILSLSGMALSLAAIKPIAKLISPFLETAPESSEERQLISRLSGNIELNNVSFRYSENMPMVINNLSLRIKKGQYVAIVGKTGCGKSTLIRLLLGFEKPLLGSVYYDARDLEKLDVKSVRRNIGVVMQNGKLLHGSIFENISISAPWLTMDDAWEAAETAGLAADIKEMPMGMFTMVSEGGGGFSGGQKQRLLIARAIASKPRILFLDEATSALDNITQKHVAEALDKIKSTRLVIAHRLSTIRQCDRIIVLEKGSIAEDGTYEELMKLDGVFAELVARQQLDPVA